MAKINSNTYVEPGAATTLNAARGQYNNSLRSLLTNFKSNSEPTFTNITAAGETIGPVGGMLFRDDFRQALYIYDEENTKRSYSNFTRNGIGYRLEESNLSLAANAETYEIGEIVVIASENVAQFANSAVYVCVSNSTVANSTQGFLQLANASDLSLLRLSSNASVFRYNALDEPNPLEQNVSFTASLFNIDEIPTWTTSPANVVLSGDDYNKVLTVGDFDNAASEFIQVTANTSGFTDTVTLYKLNAGASSNTIAQVNLFHKNTSDTTSPTFPSGDLIYTFADNDISGTLNGWDTATPNLLKGEYMWSTTATADSPNTTDIVPAASLSLAKVVAIGGEDGLSAITIVLSNPTFILPASSAGVVSSYVGSGTEVRAYEGDTQLNYNTTGADTIFSISSVTTTGIGVGTISDNGTFSTVGQHDTMSSSVESLTITYNIVGKRLDGTAFTAIAVQTIGKSRAGVDAEPPTQPDLPLNTAIVTLFQKTNIGASAPSDPATLTYTFASKTFTNSPTNGWSTTAPSLNSGEQLYVIRASASSTGTTDTIPSSEWSSASVEGIAGETGNTGNTGASGTTVAAVTLFRKNTSSVTAPTDPTGSVTYNFNTGAISGSTNGWTISQPSLSTGEYMWAITATASAPAGTSTDSILNNEWSTASLVSRVPEDANLPLNTAILTLFQKTNIGASAPSDPATLTYTFASKSFTSTPTNGWSTTAPSLAAGEQLYVIRASASSTGTTDTIPSSEWSSASVEGIAGETGNTGNTGNTGDTGASGTTAVLVTLFQESSSSGTPPSDPGTTTFTFSSGAISGTTNGWTTSQPSLSNGEYMWAITAIASATAPATSDTIFGSNWSQASLVSRLPEDADPPLNTAILTLFQKTNIGSSAPSDPNPLTYTFASKSFTSNPTGGWATTAPSLTAGEQLYVIRAVASSTGSTDYISSSEWSPASVEGIAGQQGNTGNTGDTGATGDPGITVALVTLFNKNSSNSAPPSDPGTTIFTFNTGAVTGINNGWTTSQPTLAKGEYMWSISATASGTSTSDNIGGGEWSAAVVVGYNPIDGINAILSNESHTIPVDVNGNNGDYTGSGTTLRVYEGSNLLTYTTGTVSNSRYSVSVSASNITGDTIASGGSTATYTNASNMTSDTANITYTISGKDSAGNNFTITKVQSFTKSYTGSNGIPAKLLRINASGQSFKFSPTNTQIPASQSISFVADVQGTDSPTVTWSTSPTVAMSSIGSVRIMYWSVFNAAGVDKVTITATADGGDVSDSVTVYKLRDGLGGLSSELSNDSHTIPVDADGNNGDYSNSGTTISVKQGNEALTHNGVGTTPGFFKVTSSSSGITKGNITTNGSNALAASASNMTSDTATITYSITGEDTSGNSFSFTKVQTFSKSYAGPVGNRGPGRWNIGVSSLPSSSLADNRWNDGTGDQPSRPVVGDQAWFYTGTEANPTGQRVYICETVVNDTIHAWVLQNEVIDGNLLVTDTITGDKLKVDTIEANKLILNGTMFGEDGDDLIIADGGVKTDQVGTDAVSEPIAMSFTTNYVDYTDLSSGWVDLAIVVIDCTDVDEIILNWFIEQRYYTDTPSWGYRLRKLTTTLKDRSSPLMAGLSDQPSGVYADLTPGTNVSTVYSLQWTTNDTGTVNIDAKGTLTAFGRKR